MPQFSNTSKKRLDTCHPDIQLILNDLIKFMDFTVVSGMRDKEEQNALYPKFSKVKFPHSKHNANPSNAVDIAPYVPPYGALFGSPEQISKIMLTNRVSKGEANMYVNKAYARLMGAVEAIAATHGIDIVLGMDWDMDFDMSDQKFHDLGHFQRNV